MKSRIYIIGGAAVLLGASVLFLKNNHSEKGGTQGDVAVTETVERGHLSQEKRISKDESNRFTSLTDNSIRWQVRVDMLRRLDAKTLNDTEIDYLFSLLRHDVESHQKESWWVVMNEIMEQMHKQSIDPQRFDQAMLSLIKDENLDEVTRDYAIQHVCIALKNSVGTEGSKERADEIIGTLVEVIQTPSALHSTIAGTTLMALVDAASSSSVQPLVEVAFTALEPVLMPIISGDTASNLSTRTSAINAVGMLGNKQYLPEIRAIVSNEQANDSAKLSSIASLGCMGEEQDLETLQQIAFSNTKFRHAATAALNKLSK